MDANHDTHIVCTPDTRGGKPRIAGTRITVGDVAAWHLSEGRSLHDISATLDLDLAALHAAMSYYYDHRAEIDRQTEEAVERAEALRASHPSKLA